MDNKPTSSSTTEDRLSILKSRLSVAKAFCKKPHEAWKAAIAEYELTDTSDTQEVRDKVRVGMFFRRIESDMPAIFDDQPDLFFKGKGRYRAFDEYFDNVYDYLWDIQQLEELAEDAAAYFLAVGMGFVDSPWVTESETVTEMQPQDQPVIDPMTGAPQTQQVMTEVSYQKPIKNRPEAKVKDLFKIYFSPETKFKTTLDANNCPYYFEEMTMQTDKVKALFGKDVEATGVLHTNISEIDLEIDKIKEDENSKDKDDVKRVTVYKYVGTLPQEYAKSIKDDKKQSVAWDYKTAYECYFTINEELSIKKLNYHCYPLLVLGNYGFANTFFKFGDYKHLKPLISEYQQYRTQLLRHTRKMANPKVMAPVDSEFDEDAFKDPNTGRIVKYRPGDRGEKPEYLSPAALGSEVSAGIEISKTDIEQQSGSFQLAQGSNQSTVKTPRGIRTFSEAADRNVRRKRKKVARFLRDLIKFQFKEVSMNWDPQDPNVTDIILGGEEQQPQQLSPMQGQPNVLAPQPQEEQKPDPAEVLQLLGDENVLAKVEIEVESLSVNKVEMKQEALDFFDVAAQHPDIFNVQEAARDLVQNGFNKKDADRYLVSTEQMKAQAVQEFVQQIGQMNPQLGGAIAQMIQSPNMAQMQQGQNEPQANGGGAAQLPPPQAGGMSPIPPMQKGGLNG
jgi:hypothetical protein